MSIAFSGFAIPAGAVPSVAARPTWAAASARTAASDRHPGAGSPVALSASVSVVASVAAFAAGRSCAQSSGPRLFRRTRIVLNASAGPEPVEGDSEEGDSEEDDDLTDFDGDDWEDSGDSTSSAQAPPSGSATGSQQNRSRAQNHYAEDNDAAMSQWGAGKTTPLDVLLPGGKELVNTDVPNHPLDIYRSQRSPMVKTGDRRNLGRSRQSRKKLEFRLKQGPQLAHDNWKYPSRIRITTGSCKGRRLEQPPVYVRPMMEKVREALFNSLSAMHLFEDRSVRVLDLFSGTGSLGIEALSRGASECIFVDSSKECVDACIANAWFSGFLDQEEAAKGAMNERYVDLNAPLSMVGGPRAQVQMELHRASVARSPVGAVKADALDFLDNPEKYGIAGRTFNLVVCCPPYNEISYRQLCTALASSELIERDALVCIEYPREMGSLPPILCAPFEDPEDDDGICEGIPMLYGLRNRTYSNSIMAIYSKLPTGARGSVAEPRPYEFTEKLVSKHMTGRTRELWQTSSIFRDDGERGFAKPKPKPRLKE